MALTLITGGGALTRANIAAINANFENVALGGYSDILWLQPSAVGVSKQDGSGTNPFTDLGTAYATGVAGANQAIALVGNGVSAGTNRIDAAFTWAKSGLNLIGCASPSIFGQRARLAPTGTDTAFANFFTVSGEGCLFSNLQFYQGFNTGTTSAICLTVTGSQNVFQTCAIDGMQDAASAASAGSRDLKIGAAGSGENRFIQCSIGTDTISRTNANANIEFAGGTPRNSFEDCIVSAYSGDGAQFWILGTGNACVDRVQYFKRTLFANPTSSAATILTAGASFSTSAPGGLVAFLDCGFVGCTAMGDTNFKANSYTNQPAAADTGGLMHVLT